MTWRRLAIEGFDRLQGKGIFYGAARSEASNVHGLDVHIVGAGNSAGQAAMFFSTYARSVSILCRGDGLQKSMSRYLIDQLASRANIRVAARARRSSPRTATPRSRRSTSTTPRPARRRGSTRAGVFIFIGADAETEWLPPEIALDPNGFVLTGRGRARRRRLGARPRPLPARDERPGDLRVRRRPVRAGEAVAAAVGEGSMAIAFVHQFLRDAAVQRAG